MTAGLGQEERKETLQEIERLELQEAGLVEATGAPVSTVIKTENALRM